MAPRWTTPASLWTEAWDLLEQAPQRATDPFRYPMLATSGGAGPELRTVVLRLADRANAQLEIYTDLRTPKVSEIRHDNRIGLAAWDPDALLQVRFRATAAVITGTPAISKWNALPPHSREAYAAVTVPGKALGVSDNRHPDPDARYFAVLDVALVSADIVYLGREAHQRAAYQRADGWTGRWLQP